jgi:acetamidase/formamidase
VLHKDVALTAPRAETPTHYLAIGIDVDLDRAMREAVAEAVRFLVEEKALSPKQAYTLASLAVDFSVAEAVNLTQVVTASIPKSLFDD